MYQRAVLSFAEQYESARERFGPASCRLKNITERPTENKLFCLQMRNIHHESTGMHVRNACTEAARNIPYLVINFVLLQATLKSPTPAETFLSH